jgi:hypothetical protein
MKRLKIAALAVLAGLVVTLLGCTSGDRKLVTISGTFSGGWTDAASAVVTVTDAFGSYSTTVTISSTIFSTPYSITGVPTGTYSMKVEFTSGSASSAYLYPAPSCTIGASNPTVVVSDTGYGPYADTETVSGVAINDDATIDFNIGGLPS